MWRPYREAVDNFGRDKLGGRSRYLSEEKVVRYSEPFRGDPSSHPFQRYKVSPVLHWQSLRDFSHTMRTLNYNNFLQSTDVMNRAIRRAFSSVPAFLVRSRAHTTTTPRFRPMSTVPETAQAIRIEKNGGVEVLEKKTIPLKVSPGEVVIKVTGKALRSHSRVHQTIR